MLTHPSLVLVLAIFAVLATCWLHRRRGKNSYCFLVALVGLLPLVCGTQGYFALILYFVAVSQDFAGVAGAVSVGFALLTLWVVGYLTLILLDNDPPPGGSVGGRREPSLCFFFNNSFVPVSQTSVSLLGCGQRRRGEDAMRLFIGLVVVGLFLDSRRSRRRNQSRIASIGQRFWLVHPGNDTHH
jgi:hypothetical protein